MLHACQCVSARTSVLARHPSAFVSFCLLTGGKISCVYHHVFSHVLSVGETNFSFSYSWGWEKWRSHETVQWQEVHIWVQKFISVTLQLCESFLCVISKLQCLICPMHQQHVMVPLCHRSRALLRWVLNLLLCCDEHTTVKGVEDLADRSLVEFSSASKSKPC